MTATKTNERPGTKAVLRHFHMSSSKARQVLNLIRGKDVNQAADILKGVEREAARVISKVLESAIANAVHNDGQIAEDLYIASAYADEGTTMKRWRPRARGRATRIRKRTTHITIIVARMDDDRLEQRLAARQAAGVERSRRVAGSQRRADQQQRGRRRDAAREAELEAVEAEAGTDEEEVETEVVEVETVETVDAETSAVTDSKETDEEEAKPKKAAAKKTTAKKAPAKKAAATTTKKAAASNDDDAESEEEGK